MGLRLYVCFCVLPLVAVGHAQEPTPDARRKRAEAVLETEATIETLRGPVAELSRSIQNLTLPDERGRALFASRVEVVDLARPNAPQRQVADLNARETHWTLDTPTVREAKTLSLWMNFLEGVDYFENAGFYTIRGAFATGDRSSFRSPSGFKARARMTGGGIAWVRAKLDIDWKRVDGNERSAWLVEAFRTREFTVTTAPVTLYRDVAAEALSPEDLANATRSKRDELLIDLVSGVRTGRIDLDGLMGTLIASLEDGSLRDDWSHVSVVDIDRDGHDDIYLMPYDSPALLFRNGGDGTFYDVSSKWGLKLDGVHAALFADFDNDSDDDVVISFYPNETKIFENTGVSFVEKQAGLSGLVIAMATADYNDDGLLDLYLVRYNGGHIGAMAAALERARRKGKPVTPSFPGMTTEESQEVAKRLFEGGEPFVHVPGPPNVLLKNAGDGRFERAESAAPAEPYYQTLAASWSDIDLDGDMDLYVVNEAGPNQLVRNDGDGRFVEITDKATEDVGFGMGAAFGDFNEDGRPDIYVTNMYSKAGLRIADQMRSEERVVSSARGNSLLRNTGAGYELVSGASVEQADFGWGGAFLDVNNDGTLDLYAPAGYVTMPPEVAAVGDS